MGELGAVSSERMVVGDLGAVSMAEASWARDGWSILGVSSAWACTGGASGVRGSAETRWSEEGRGVASGTCDVAEVLWHGHDTTHGGQGRGWQGQGWAQGCRGEQWWSNGARTTIDK